MPDQATDRKTGRVPRAGAATGATAADRAESGVTDPAGDAGTRRPTASRATVAQERPVDHPPADAPCHPPEAPATPRPGASRPPTTGPAVVTAAGIARLAGVGRAAVSNWRRRHPDFPRPVGGSGASPVFSLAEVEGWLRAQGKMAEVPLRERVWQALEGHPEGLAAALRLAGETLLTGAPDLDAPAASQAATAVGREAAGPEAAAPTPGHDAPGGGAAPPWGTALWALAEELGGPAAAYEFLLGRYLDAQSRHSARTPAVTAELMAALVGPARAVLDPACGSGRLLVAALGCLDGPPPRALYGQEADPVLARLAALRLALRRTASVPGVPDRTAGVPPGRQPAAPPPPAVSPSRTPPTAAAPAARRDAPVPPAVHVRTGDALRANAHPRLAVDAVLCHPPFNVRDWGHDELAGDPRWRYGRPARTESELAWVQHVLYHLAPGGHAVLLLPPATASRRSGRRVRAALLREGVLRAVIALPPGAAAPHNLPLHLWVLRRPPPDGGLGAPSAGHLLLVDAATRHHVQRRGPVPWRSVSGGVLAAWRAFARDGDLGGRPGLSRAVSVDDLLDDEVDLAPARHVPAEAPARGVAGLPELRQDFERSLRRSVELAPLPARATRGRRPPARHRLTTVGELARVGALVLRAGGSAPGPPGGTRGELPVLTVADVLEGAGPSGALPVSPGAPGDEASGVGRRGRGEPVLVRADDVVVPVLGDSPVARVLSDRHAGAVLGRHLCLLRCDPRLLDPWFVAGFLRGSGNARQASSYASGASRLDVRRLWLPRLPLAEQHRYGRRFRRLAEFEAALRRTSELGERLLRGAFDELTDGALPEHRDPA